MLVELKALPKKDECTLMFNLKTDGFNINKIEIPSNNNVVIWYNNKVHNRHTIKALLTFCSTNSH